MYSTELEVKRKLFRIRAKKFFLTYPKVIDLPGLERLFLRGIEGAFKMGKRKMKYIIVKKLHEDGMPHIYIYLEFKKTQSLYSRDRLHVKLTNTDGKAVVQEGKYEAVRKKESVIQYILENVGKDYITNIF